MKLFTGTSGWSHPQWKGGFYSAGLKNNLWLAHYAGAMNSVELNASFYRLPGLPTVARWALGVPEGFRFAVKAWQAITHEKRLRNCREEVAALWQVVEQFGAHAGPVLFQLPPSLARDDALLEDFLSGLPPYERYAIEFRHASWRHEGVYNILRDHHIALCSGHLRGWQPPLLTTAPFAYLRLHGPHEAYKGSYDETFLRKLAAWLEAQGVEEAYVYFNNTMGGDQAVREAAALREMVGEYST